jgi:GNAT superfamily N-acetyltransferase
MKEDIVIRDYVAEDLAFFYKSCLHHYKHSSLYTRYINDEVFYDSHHYLITQCLRRPTAVLRFASLAEDPNIVFGFIWADLEPETVHYIYVKKAFRRLGIARLLIDDVFDDDQEIYFTHMTRDAGFIIEKIKGFIYNPYLLHQSIYNFSKQPTGKQ